MSISTFFVYIIWKFCCSPAAGLSVSAGSEYGGRRTGGSAKLLWKKRYSMYRIYNKT